MSKVPKPGPEYSREREFTVVLEDLRSQFRAFGEGLENVQRGLDEVRERLGRLETDVAQLKIDVGQLKIDVGEMKSFFKPLTATVSDHEHRLTALERTR